MKNKEGPALIADITTNFEPDWVMGLPQLVTKKVIRTVQNITDLIGVSSENEKLTIVAFEVMVKLYRKINVMNAIMKQ